MLKKLIFVVAFVVVLAGSIKLSAEERSIKIYKTPSIIKVEPAQLFCEVPEYVELFKRLEVDVEVEEVEAPKIDLKLSVYDVLCGKASKTEPSQARK